MDTTEATDPRMQSTLDTLSARIESDPDVAEEWADLRISRDVATMFVALRHMFGLNQSGFAKRAGLSQARIAQLESGAANPTVQTLARILRSVGVSLQLQPEIAMTDKATSDAWQTLRTRAGADQLTEGERITILTVADGTVQAIRDARVGGELLTIDSVVHDIRQSAGSPRSQAAVRNFFRPSGEASETSASSH